MECLEYERRPTTASIPVSLGRQVQEKGAKAKFNSNCRTLEFKGKHQVSCVIHKPTGLPLNGIFYHAVCSLPASTLAKLVAQQHPVLSKELSEIRSVTVGVVNIFKRSHLKESALGFLFPNYEKLLIVE